MYFDFLRAMPAALVWSMNHDLLNQFVHDLRRMLLLTKREDTTRASIVLSIIAMNTDRLAAMLLRFIQFLLNFRVSYGLLVHS